MKRLISLALLASLLCGIGWSRPARAVELCVNSVATLEQAMALFPLHPAGARLTIKVVQGTYLVGNRLGGGYYSETGASLAVLGGYTAGCNSRILNPANTILDAGHAPGSGIHTNFDAHRNIRFEGLTFTRFNESEESVLTSYMDIEGGDNGDFIVRNCRFINNSGTNVILVEAPRVELVNNLIVNNTIVGAQIPGIEPSAITVGGRVGFNFRAAINNNTIAFNSGAPGLRIAAGLDSDRVSEVANNIIWGNGTPDVDLSDFDYDINELIFNTNLYGNIANPSPLATGGLVANPLFQNAGAGNFALSPSSPAVNSGGAYQLYGIPGIDLIGNPRITGSNIDRGALESGIDDTTQFVVTNAADNGNNASPTPGSLRAAIKAANAASGPYLISFALTGTCPRLITMSTPMLDIVGNVTIDGRTQPGWTPNTSETGFAANLCLVLSGSGNAPYAFHVPGNASNARLSVYGMMFAGFSDAAIKIEAGSGHRIGGNQFGAVPFTAANQDAIRVTANAGSVFIGGYDDPATVNLIAGSLGAGVYLDNAAGGSTVANNYIGFQPDGIGQNGNVTGVFLFNSPNNFLRYNQIGFSASNGISISGSGSSGNVLQYNRIGTGLVHSAPNQGAGVNLLFAAHDNTIGASQNGNAGGNDIIDNLGPGIWISTSGGNGNRVLGNFTTNNGVGGTGLDIDLAAAGPTGNQVSNPATGPNRLQNYPNLTQARLIPGTHPTVDITATLASALSRTYRIDVYYDPNCDVQAPTRGQARSHLGRGTLATNSAGVGSSIFTLPLPAGLGLGKVSATATSAQGDTSEIGTCISMIDGTPPDPLFADGFEH